MVGRIEGRIDGRPFYIEAEGQTVRLRFESVRDAWRSRKALRRLTRFGESASSQFGITVEFAAAGVGPLAVLPQPHWLVRPFLR